VINLQRGFLRSLPQFLISVILACPPEAGLSRIFLTITNKSEEFSPQRVDRGNPTSGNDTENKYSISDALWSCFRVPQNTLDNFGELVELYMHGTEAKRIFTKGLEGLAQGDTLLALGFFEKVRQMENSPVVDSYYAFCIAKERGQVSKAISLCKESIKREPNNSLHYLNLGRIHLLENNKTEAIRIFREGLNFEENLQIVEELKRLEIRKPPIFRFLKRSNPINKYFGIILKKLRLR
jgi:tetratricopeptide (TPR) repeat protein